jgi:hypothetical protein
MTSDDQDARPIVTDPDAGEPIETGRNDEPETHTAALQGAAAGGALSGNAGYAGGLLTGSEDHIGIAEIPDPDEATTGDDAA